MKKTGVKLLCLALTLCFVLFALAACGGDTAKDEAKKVSVTVIDGDKKIPVEIEIGKTVKDALDAAKVTLGEKDTVDPRAEAKITADAKEITVKRADAAAAVKVSMTIDGKTSEVSTSAATVEALLKEQKITLGDEDKINAKLTDKVTEGMQIKIVRTVYKEEKKTEKIAFDTEETTSDSLAEGESQVTREGVEGEKEVTYKVKYVDGKETGREVVSEKVIKEPVNKQVTVGAGTSSDNGNDSGNNDGGDDSGNDDGGEDEVYEVSRVDMPNCNGDGHGYYIVTYSDGHQEYPEY